MGGQFEQLLVSVARQVEGTAALVKSLTGTVDELARTQITLRERLSAIETNQKWNGRERRKVDERLGSGDQTFKKLLYDVQQNATALGVCQRQLADLQAEHDELVKLFNKMRGRGKSWAVYLWRLVIQGIIPLAISGIAWLILNSLKGN